MSLFDQDQPAIPSFEPEPEVPEWWRNFRLFVWETVKVIIISLLIIVPVRYFLIQPFYVQGASMEPNFYDREYLIIDEISYRFEDPARGDIVVFRYPRDPKQFFIKRVIGLPGEQVAINNSQISIYNSQNPDGFKLNELNYLAQDVKTSGNLKVSLDDNEYYVLGDNRSSSLDSRGFGPIRSEAIVGKVWLRGWPVDRVAVIGTPEYDL